MREIKAQQITDVVKALCIKANCYLPADVKKRIEDLRAAEPWPQAQEVLDRIIENYEKLQKKYKFLMNILSNTVNIKQKLIIIILKR